MSIAKLVQRLNTTGGRLMGLDVGERYVGMAVTLPCNTRAKPLDVLLRKKAGPLVRHTPEVRRQIQLKNAANQGQNNRPEWYRPKNYFAHRPAVSVPVGEVADKLRRTTLQHNIQGIVVGLPLQLDGTRGPECDRVFHFVEEMRKAGGLGSHIGLYWWNERDSTRMALEAVEALGSRKARKDKHLLDKMCACFILNQFIRANLKVNPTINFENLDLK